VREPLTKLLWYSATLSAKSEVGLTLAGSPCVPSYRLIGTGRPVSSGLLRNVLTGSVCRGAWRDSLSE